MAYIPTSLRSENLPVLNFSWIEKIVIDSDFWQGKKHSAKVLWAGLASIYNAGKRDRLRLSQKTLSKYLGMSKNTLTEATRVLEDNDLCGVWTDYYDNRLHLEYWPCHVKGRNNNDCIMLFNVPVMSWRKLSNTAIVLHLTMRRHANPFHVDYLDDNNINKYDIEDLILDTRTWEPLLHVSKNRLSELSGLHRPGINSKLAELEKFGLIEKYYNRNELWTGWKIHFGSKSHPLSIEMAGQKVMPIL